MATHSPHEELPCCPSSGYILSMGSLPISARKVWCQFDAAPDIVEMPLILAAQAFKELKALPSTDASAIYKSEPFSSGGDFVVL